MSAAHPPEALMSEDEQLAQSRQLLSVFPVAVSVFGAGLMFTLCYLAVHFG
jgi:hypothetical protein